MTSFIVCLLFVSEECGIRRQDVSWIHEDDFVAAVA